MVSAKRLGESARRIRKFGDMGAVVARKSGLGSVAKAVQERADKLADMLDQVKEESDNPIDRAAARSRERR